jgi:hypothetical protein
LTGRTHTKGKSTARKRKAGKGVGEGPGKTSDCTVDDDKTWNAEPREGETGSNDWNGEAAENNKYVSNDAYGCWQSYAPKRARNKSMRNKQQRSWVLGMRRNWENHNQAKRMANITIKRDQLHMVTLLH